MREKGRVLSNLNKVGVSFASRDFVQVISKVYQYFFFKYTYGRTSYVSCSSVLFCVLLKKKYLVIVFNEP